MHIIGRNVKKFYRTEIKVLKLNKEGTGENMQTWKVGIPLHKVKSAEEECIQPTSVRNSFPERAKFKVVKSSLSWLLTPVSGLDVALR
jgi:hypothetical protein